ncbi:AAA family ATPase [Herbiconiux daphne]|uniref:AAA family ATPase n=1 Tax=Herbiconiux daphne TaxID=2970914 RepID=A0ABT2H568_9MICO|nr:AAA family ATPase [Herbiconiux daphne]MCS5735100.1 AAA family ATPase [Herbiconiux daphne]
MPTPELTEHASTPVSSSPLSIRISNCNNLDSAEITLVKSALNIKYGPNGIGKSTIAQALTLRADGGDALKQLIPFKYRGGTGHPDPTVTGADSIRKVLTFDDRYVSQFVFQQDEVLKNSFEIFINTVEFQNGNQEIEDLFAALQTTFVEQEEFNDAVHAFTHLCDVFGVTKTGVLSKSTRGYKAMAVGGKLNKIPEPLRGYSGFLQSEDPASWVAWQAKGKSFLELSDNCPFCSVESVDKATAELVSREYETATVKNMSLLRAAVETAGHYFDPSYLEQLSEMFTLISEPKPEQLQFLATLRGEVEVFLDRLKLLRGLAFHTLRDQEKVDEYLSGLKVNLALLRSLNSDATRSVVELINAKLEEVASQISVVKERVGQQRGRVKRLIEDNQRQINAFLESAGYRYQVSIQPNEDSYRMLIEHQDLPGHLGSANSHLSYGERNAFALVLFMYQVRHEKPDLVVLDDPVSSFDQTKKFAILHELFRGKHSIRDQTTLMLTHDLEPAIDIVRLSTRRLFAMAKPVAHFLTSKAGTITEKPILHSDLKTFGEVCDANIAAASDIAIKLIYLRRKFEILGMNDASSDVLSSLLHLRAEPDRPIGGGDREPLEAAEVAEAVAKIGKSIPGFDYDALVQEFRDLDLLKAKFAATTVGYEKVQIFRMMLEINEPGEDDTFKKFVNETFHIENEYVMQLDPREFDSVPEFVVAECTRQVELISAA